MFILNKFLIRPVGLLHICMLLFSSLAIGQSPPNNLNIDEENHIMKLEGLNPSSFYDEDVLESVYLEFKQTNFWQQLHNAYDTENYVLGTLTYKGEVIDSIGAQFKGNTSYTKVTNNQKYSFAISLDEYIDGQDIEGYNTLNFNNAFQDASFMKEVLYNRLNRFNIPGAKGNFIKLYINGEYWGIYDNIQQLNKDFTKEWFMTNNGSLWRGDAPSTNETKSATEGGRPPGGGGGGGGGGGTGSQWGDGTTALNYLGADTALYQKYYTLKHSSQDNPWDILLKLTDVLNNTPDADLLARVSNYLDVDKTLWFLAHETVFTDDDSYIMKGRQDYYLYYEPETGLCTPLEFDGNSALDTKNINWGMFYNEEKVNYPLMNRLYAIPEIRQRYLAHARTIIDELLDVSLTDSLIDKYDALIRSSVEADTKNMYTFSQYKSDVEELKAYFSTRKNILQANSEVKENGLTITSVEQKVNDVLFAAPLGNEPVNITATISGTKGVHKIYLYYSQYYVGSFNKTEMYDDGMHYDGNAGDGIYGGEIPGYPSGEYVRYYVEAIADDAAKTAAYAPVGAEHDVYYYKVEVEESEDSDIVINEFMAANDNTLADVAGEFDDWLELFNKSTLEIDISGYFLSDDSDDYFKWEFPSGTKIKAGEYLLIWADDDESQEGLHTNFKLSAAGEDLFLLDNNGIILDKVFFNSQINDVSFGRLPNGTGYFQELSPSPGLVNQFTVSAPLIAAQKSEITIYPNPTFGLLNIKCENCQATDIIVHNMLGELVYNASNTTQIDVSGFKSGAYILSTAGERKIFVVKPQ